MDQRKIGGRGWRVGWLLIPAALLMGCQVPYIAEEDLPVLEGAFAMEERGAAGGGGVAVTRQEVIQTARRYAAHRWQPTEANVLHGLDADGVRVDTPDISFTMEGTRPGWWVPNQVNQGMPYMWGGFSSLEAFDAGVAAGLAAGDVLTPEKRELLSEGMPTVSRHAVGIGASGFISRCWKLDRSYSTRELAVLCEVLDSYEDLLPGDILNLRDVHVILFEQFADDEHKGLLGYEAGAPPSWKVVYDHLPVSHLQRLGYQALRYREIRGAENDAAVLGLRPEGPPSAAPVDLPPAVDEGGGGGSSSGGEGEASATEPAEAFY